MSGLDWFLAIWSLVIAFIAVRRGVRLKEVRAMLQDAIQEIDRLNDV